MAQHDYNIANQSGAAFRQDLNNALAAAVSQNSGAVEPSTTYAYQFWADTSAGVLKMRNAANSAWITLFPLSSGITADKIEEGNTSAEVIDTGSDGRFVVTTEGSERLRITSAGLVGVGTSSPSTILHVNTSVNNSSDYYLDAGATALIRNDNASGVTSLRLASSSNSTSALAWGGSGSETLIFANRQNERARIDSSGRLLVGTSTAQGNSTVTIEQIGANSAPLALRYTNTNNNQIGIDFYRSRSSSAKVESADPLMRLDAYGYDGSTYRKGASIEAIVDAATSAGDMPCRLVFSTTADGASSPTERMRINSAGQIVTTYSGDAAVGLVVTSTSTNFTSDVLNIRASRNTSNSTYSFFKCTRDGVADVLFIRDSGNVQNANNSYGAISDQKLKENIVDANSQWDDLKALQVRNYNFKPETGQQTHTQIGLIAQEVELVSPGLVSESPDRERVEVPLLDADGNPVLDDEGNPRTTTEERDLGTVTKSVNYSVLYMKAVKALQEAMERIETLEAKVAAMETPAT